MNKEDIFAVIKQEISNILPNVDADKIAIEGKMADYGANSIDRADIVIATMEKLNIVIPIVELTTTKNLTELVELFDKHLNK